MPTTTFTVSTESDLDSAIQLVDEGGADAATDTAYTIDVAGPIDLGAGLPAVDLASGSSLTIAETGGAETLGDGSEAGLVVSAGTVTVANLMIANAVAQQGGTLVIASGGTASGTVIDGGTLDLQQGGVLAGSVAFAGGGTLQIDGSTMPAATISEFGTGETIDLTGIAFDPAGSAVLTTGNVLQVSEGGQTVALHLDPAQSFAGHGFALASDGHGGTDLVDPPTLTTLVSFNGTNGANPFGGLIADAAGDLFGTTSDQGANGDGTVFEIAKNAGSYASTPTTLFSFNGSNGANPQGTLIADAAGDLFGMTDNGGASGDGTVFEIAKTGGSYASTPTTLVSFNGTNGLNPQAGLIADAAGDLFATTAAGGASGDGTVFELVNNGGGSYTLTTLVSFNGSDGKGPAAALIADAAGDLFGTTNAGGASGDGTVFEIAKTGGSYASTPTTLVSFNGTNGANPQAALIADAAGDLFGTTRSGGANGDGTVFELVNNGGSYTLTTLVSFNGTDGAQPHAGLIADAAGDLFGMTEAGGASGDGTAFEIAKTGGGYAGTPTTLISFNGTDGEFPVVGLIADAAGDLFGPAFEGGASSSGTVGGTVFELSGTGFQTLAETVGGPYSGNENNGIALGGLSVSASPNTGDPLTTVLSVAHGTLTVGTAGGATISNNATASVSLSGTAAQIDADLAGAASYQGNLDYYGPDTLSLTTTDTADGNQASATAAITVNEILAPAGYYYPSAGATAAIIDPVGTYSNVAGLSAAIPAPPGSYVGTTGATAATQDTPGTFTAMAGSTAASPAPPGSYVPTAGATAATQDMPGTFTSTAGSSAASPAPPGSYVSTAGAIAATQDMPGTFTNTAGSSAASPAPPGSYVPTAGATAATQDMPGTFTSAAGSSAASPAPPGSYVPTAGATAATQDMPGTFTSTAGSSAASPAPPGSYVPTAGATAATQDMPGTFTSTAGSSAPSPAPPGSYVPTAGATAATLDQPGTFTSTAGSSAATPAPPGSYVATAGATAATLAPAGSYDPGYGNTAPIPVTAPDLGLLLGAGPAGADNWTNSNNPMFAGQAFPGSTVVLYDGATKIGNGQANAQGVWTITANTMPLGTNMITATATDPQGHTTTSAASDILMISGTSFQTSSNGTGNENANFQGASQPNTFQFGNGTVVVIATNGPNTVTGGGGNDTVRLGDGPDNVSLGNGNDTVTLGNGNNTVTLGSGTDSLIVGTGPNTINLGSGSYTVTAGGGNDSVSQTGNGGSAALGGGGNYNVSVSGNSDTLTLGNGNDSLTVSGAGTGESVVAGTGNDTFTLGSSMTSLVMQGMHDTVSVIGGKDTLTDTLGGVDQLMLQVGGTLGGAVVGGIVSVANFSPAHGVLLLAQALATAEGWSSPGAVDAALTTDSSGTGSLLSLGAHGSVDFQNLPKSQLTANNFQFH